MWQTAVCCRWSCPVAEVSRRRINQVKGRFKCGALFAAQQAVPNRPNRQSATPQHRNTLGMFRAGLNGRPRKSFASSGARLELVRRLVRCQVWGSRVWIEMDNRNHVSGLRPAQSLRLDLEVGSSSGRVAFGRLSTFARQTTARRRREENMNQSRQIRDGTRIYRNHRQGRPSPPTGAKTNREKQATPEKDCILSAYRGCTDPTEDGYGSPCRLRGVFQACHGFWLRKDRMLPSSHGSDVRSALISRTAQSEVQLTMACRRGALGSFNIRQPTESFSRRVGSGVRC
jgi:hypothetical protein